jgi:hypothetical protein
MPPTTKTSSKKSKSVTTSVAPAQASTAASTTVTSTAEQPAPAPQATQAPSVILTTPVTPATPPVITGTVEKRSTGAKTALQASYVALIAGLRANYQPSDVFQLALGDKTCDEVVATLQQFVQAAENTKAAYAAYRATVGQEQAALAQARPVDQALVGVLRIRYGRTSQALLQYGVQPAKTPVRTAASKTEAVVKAKATRTARGTKGSKQKLEVSGNVTGVEITPLTAGPSVPATPVPTPATSPATTASPAPQPGAVATPVARS